MVGRFAAKVELSTIKRCFPLKKTLFSYGELDAFLQAILFSSCLLSFLPENRAEKQQYSEELQSTDEHIHDT